MGSTLNFKRVCLLFAAVLLGYFVVFKSIEFWRRMNGPWIVAFDTDENGRPFLTIDHQKMGVHGVRVALESETAPKTNLPARLIFDRPRLPLPFGRRLHEDLVQLPGVETFDLFGHIVELAPRRLALDGRAIPWSSGQMLRLWPSNKIGRALPPARSLQDTPGPVSSENY